MSMAVDRSLWSTRLALDFAGTYPCPRCAKGRVGRGSHEVVVLEPVHSARLHNDDEWDPDWVEEAFTAVLVCDNSACGEIVAVSGRAYVDQVEDYGPNGESWTRDYVTVLKPSSMFPAPPLFPISKQFPKTVQAELRLAFQLYWADLSASTSRLRTSLERVLDERGVPRAANGDDGKLNRLSLFARIDRFEKNSEDSDSAESMNALRIVGNLGTHGDDVAEGDYFNLLDVYEDALLDIYEEKKRKLKAKKLSLIALKDQ
ncbi:MAG: DUF4145 domain-containing protein [Hyphomicrobiales bacterium]|nr:MAG: DUF4145 domain-containing protein [Hyphomicrobiales bacterium]